MIILKKKWFDSIRNEPDLRLIGFFGRIQSAINHVERIKPDLIVINLGLPFLLGINPTQIIALFGANRQIIFLTFQDNKQEFKQILQGGGRAYLLNSSKISEIINAIRLVDRGYFYLDPRLAQRYIFEASEKKGESTSKQPAQIDDRFNNESFLVELQALNNESKSIRSLLKKIESRLHFLPNILEILILMLVLIVLVVIVIVE